ncbi:MAG: TonB-dependent receptor [Rikenellaceae bacterium]
MKFLLSLLLLFTSSWAWAVNADSDSDAEARLVPIHGAVLSLEDGKPIAYATVSLADKNRFGASTDMTGRFRMRVPSGKHTLVVTFVGYQKYTQTIEVTTDRQRPTPITIKLKPVSQDMEEVVVKSEGFASRVNKTAFNVQAVAIDNLKSNTTASLNDVLSKVNGVRIRESGGVGSDSKISLNGFSGSHVKIFIDGILQQNNGAFSLSNIPANFAEHIEVYNGVAPIEFGSDALGGVINIVTKKQNQAGWNLDASYSYGSFNTHRSNITFTHQLKGGLQYKVNAYQNYSDNNYDIDNTVILYNGNISQTSTEVYNVERFNDKYHNEAIITEVGFKGKKWADVATLSVNLAQFYKEVQTGTTQDVVYGDRHREGYSVIPTLQYSKRDLFTKGLTLKANASYDYGVTLVADTTVFNYNWFGDTQYSKSRNNTYTETTSNSWSTNANATYKASEAHTVALNYSLNSTARVSRSATVGTTFDDYDDPQYTTKSVTGLSYMYNFRDRFNAQGFGKYYTQSNDGATYDTEGNRTERNEKNGYLGYGAAGTVFFLNGFQGKFSYEKSYRLPTTTELFGDSDLELGNVGLDPESSDNFNINLTYNRTFGKHNFELGGGLIYSNTKDYIQRVVASDGESASSVNHGKVKTNGWNVSARYNFGDRFSVGGNYNILNTIDDEMYDISSGYQRVSMTYGQNMPNEPTEYASVDGQVNFYDLIKKKDHFFIVYDLFYQKEFLLDWANFGDYDTKKMVPTQLAHNITFHYTLKDGKYNFSLECRNITDANLYDNYSLQKAGRAFYGKVRIMIGNTNK